MDSNFRPAIFRRDHKTKKKTEVSSTTRTTGNVWNRFFTAIRPHSKGTVKSYESSYEANVLANKFRFYTPTILHRQLSKKLKFGEMLTPNVESYYASLILADITGFTRLASRLSSECLKQHINQFFSILIGIVHKNGGDVVKFLGDAVLIAFPYEDDASIQHKSAMVSMASLCAIQLIKECGEYKEGSGINRVSLSLHCAISCGIVYGMCLGVGERWEYLITGFPLTVLSKGIALAKAGEIFISHEAYEYIQEDFETVFDSKGHLLLTGRRLPTYNIHGIHRQRLTMFAKVQNNDSTPNLLRLGNTDFGDHKKSFFSSNKGRIFIHSNDNNNSTITMVRQSSSELFESSYHSEDDENDNSSKGSVYEGNDLTLDSNNELNVTRRLFVNYKCKANYTKKARRPTTTTTAKVPRTVSEGNLDFMTNDVVSLSTRSAPTLSNDRFSSTCIPSLGPTRKKSGSGLSEIKISPMIDSSSLALEQVKMFRKGFLPVKDEDCLFDYNHSHSYSKTQDLVLSDPSLCAALRFFVHEAARVTIEETGASYLFELRNVTSIFIDLFGLESDLNNGRVKGPQLALEICIRCLKQYGGSLRQFTVDDKGCILIAAFGLPGSTHEDNCRRAVEVAALIRQCLLDIGIGCKIGIAEGRVFCGLVGCESRCEYTMMGCSVNLAARLMASCEIGEIQVNETVYQFTVNSFVYDTLSKLHAKGYDAPVAVYRPISRVHCSSLLRQYNIEDNLVFVGRINELNMLVNAMTNIQMSPPSSNPTAIFISGLEGMGKTRLLAEALRVIESSRNYQLATGIVIISATTGRISFSAIRQLLEQIFELNDYEEKGLVLEKEENITFHENDSNINRFGSKKISPELSDTKDKSCSVVDSILRWMKKNLESNYLQYDLLPKLIEVSDTTNSEQKSYSSRLDEVISNTNINSMQSDLIEFTDTMTSIGTSVDSRDNICHDYLLLDLVPLLGEVLSFKAENNSITSALTSDQISKLREALILKIIYCCLEKSLLDVIIVDNLQWCDVASLRIFSRLAKCVPAGALLFASRPVGQSDNRRSSLLDDNNINYNDRSDCYLLNQLKSTSQLIELQPFDRHDIKLLVDTVMTADSNCSSSFHSLHSPDRIVDRIMERSNGSPLQATLLVKDLKSTLISGKYTESNSLPTEVQNIIIAQFDQLAKIDQILLKVASVVGVRFKAAEIFASIHVLNSDLTKNRLNISEALHKLAEQGTLITSKNNEFSFHDIFFCDSIYHLMTISQRKDIHTSLGSYYEARASENDYTSLNTIAYHYIRSSDTRKQWQYLQVGIEIEKADRNYYLVIRYIRELIAISVGVELDELFERYCTRGSGGRRQSNSSKGDNSNSSKQAPLSSSSLLAPLSQRIHHFATTYFTQSLSDASINGVNVNADDKNPLSNDISEQRLTLGDFQGQVTLPINITLTGNKAFSKEITLSTVCMFVWDLGVHELMLGNFITSSNILLMGMHIAGFHPSSYKITVITFLSTITTEEYNTMQDALNTLVFIHLIIGDIIFAKFVSSLSSHIKSIYLPKSDIMTAASGKYSSPRTSIETLHLLLMQANSSSIKESEKVKMKFESLLAHQDVSTIEFGNTDTVATLCQAIYYCSHSKLSMAIKLLNHAAVLTTSSGNLYHLALANLGKAWCNFLSGKITTAKEALEKVVLFASLYSNKSVYIWSLELDILIKAFSQDVPGIEFNQELISTLRGMGNGSVNERWSEGQGTTSTKVLGVTSNAVLAFSLLLTKMFHGTSTIDDVNDSVNDPYTICSKLASRKQGTVIGGIILFCSVYTTIDYYEKQMKIENNPPSRIKSNSTSTNNLRKTSLTTISGLTSSNSSTHIINNKKALADKFEKVVKVGINALVQHAIRFPALASLSLAIKMRMLRIHGCKMKDLSELDKEVKHSYIFHRQHVFAEGILHLERSLLCKHLSITTDFLKIDDSLQIASICLSKLGVESTKLNFFFEEFRSYS